MVLDDAADDRWAQARAPIGGFGGVKWLPDRLGAVAGLGEIVVGALFEGVDQILLVAARRQLNDIGRWCIGVALECGQGLHAIFDGDGLVAPTGDGFLQ